MGRVKSTYVKSSAAKIYEKGKAEFTNDYDKNKEIVVKYANIPSKRMRNSVVGYIVRLKNRDLAE